MSRLPHYIRSNKNNETPQQAFWFDTETTGVRISPETVGHRLRFGWVAYARRRPSGQWTKPEWFRFEEPKQFWEWVLAHCRPKTALYGFCHNTSFDLPILDTFRHLPQMGWQLGTAVIDAPPTILHFKRDGMKLTILDTLNFWRVPLKALGESIGLPKLPMPAADAPESDWVTYGRRDVEILCKACISWWDWLVRDDLGGFAPTLASQALRTWRHKYMPTKVLCHGDADLLAMEREAYHGGRVECFRIGRFERRFWVLDVNSLYPSVMQSKDYPSKIAFQRRNCAGFPVMLYASQYASIARVTVDTPEPVYPIVREGKLLFPVGRFDTTLCGPELWYAHEHGHVAEFHRVAYYETAPLFREFVDDLYARRIEAKAAGDAVRTYYIKIMMNSLYGKFGQRGQVWEEQEPTEDLAARSWVEVDAETRQATRYRQLGGLVQRLEKEPEARDSVPAIAAYVTSYARMRLWGLMQLAGRGNVYYVDTDSLVVTDAGLHRLKPEIDPDRLGALKNEGWIPYIELRGPKDYDFGLVTRIKGVRANAQWTSRNDVRQERWRGLRGQLADGVLDMPTTTMQPKHLSRTYTKGQVAADGVVSPLVLPGDDA